MKFKGLCIALLFVFILSAGSIVFGSQVVPNSSSDIKIIASNTNLRVGDFGFVTIVAKPNTRYVLKTTYQRGNIKPSVTQIRVTDAQGLATFNWVVQNGTTPGTNTATISGGGSSINFIHTVIK